MRREAAAAAASFKSRTAPDPLLAKPDTRKLEGRAPSGGERKARDESEGSDEEVSAGSSQQDANLARKSLSSGKAKKQAEDDLFREWPDGHQESDEGQEGEVVGSEQEVEEEDLDGYKDLGWGEQKPITGEDIASLLVRLRFPVLCCPQHAATLARLLP